MATYNGEFEQKVDTAANWASANPILRDGQIGFDKTNKIFKIGDGVTAWNSITSWFSRVPITKAASDPSNPIAAHEFWINSTSGKLFYSYAANTIGEIPVAGFSGALDETLGGTGHATFAKGDILVAKDATTLVKVPVGATGYILSADPTTESGLKWIPAPSGSNITPAAPTGGVVDDTANTFAFTAVSGYTVAAGDYEYSTDAGVTYVPLATNPIGDLNGNYAIGDVRVRVKAATGRNAGQYLANATAFTASDGDVTWTGTVNSTQTGNDIATNTTVASYGARSTQIISPTAPGKFLFKVNAAAIADFGSVDCVIGLISQANFNALANAAAAAPANLEAWFRGTSLYRQNIYQDEMSGAITAGTTVLGMGINAAGKIVFTRDGVEQAATVVGGATAADNENYYLIFAGFNNDGVAVSMLDVTVAYDA